MKYQWTTSPIDGPVVSAIRRDNRKFRREKGRAGHRFRFIDLRFLWVAGTNHAILTHYTDRSWQYWYRHPTQGWLMESYHENLADAKMDAEVKSLAEPDPHSPKTNADNDSDDHNGHRKPGVYVTGVWKEEPYRDHLPPLTIRCATQFSQGIYTKILKDLGCSVTQETVSK